MALAVGIAIFRAERQMRVPAAWLAHDGQFTYIGLGMACGALLGGSISVLLARTSHIEPIILGAIAGAGFLGTLGSNLALVISDDVRAAMAPQQWVFVRFLIVQASLLALFLLALGLSYLKGHPDDSTLIQLGGGVFALGLASTGTLKKFMPYALMLDPQGIVVGLPAGALLGVLTGYVAGGPFPLVAMAFGALGIGSYLAVECAEFTYARRHAPGTLEASPQALAVRIAATSGGLALGFLVGDHWRNEWIILFVGAAGATFGFYATTINQSVVDYLKRRRTTAE
jgi:hypothetical protein